MDSTNLDSTDLTNTAASVPASPAPTSPPPAREGVQEWVSPGVSVRKRWLTGIGVALAAAVFLLIARSEGTPALVSTIIGIVFIGCFVWYLRIVAPTPFTLTLDSMNLTKADSGAEPVVIAWQNVAKVKEEVFKNGTSVSVTVYKRVGAKGLHRAWVVYRDDIPRFDAFVDAARAALPEETPWIRERVHE